MKKFRVWNGKAMEYGGFSIHATGALIKDSALGDFFSDAPVMQYTGLRDKNNNPIYEGDIVSEKWGARIEIEAVEYEAPGFDPFQYSGGGEFTAQCCEVIGNIYQNPELLT